MQKVIIGIKKGMTQVFDAQGNIVPVSIVDTSDVFLVNLTKINNFPYVVLGYKAKRNPSNAEKKKFETIGKTPKKQKTFKVEDESIYSSIKPGDAVKPSIFSEGDITNVTGRSKGKGFAGGVKRWGFKGGKQTHGQSDRERAPGAIGAGTGMGRVIKGKTMAGRMGSETKTIKNLKVISIDDSNNILLVKGAIPGVNGSLVTVRA